MLLTFARNQPTFDDAITFDGTITTGGTAQLLLPQQPRRAFLLIQNLAATAINMNVGIGPATATATLTSGTVSSIAVNNAGIGYTVAPQVQIMGGIVNGDYTTCPSNQATAVATISAGAVSAITMVNVGSGYLVAPLVYLYNPYPQLGGGAFVPSATAGIALVQNGSLLLDTAVPNSAVAIFGTTTGSPFICKVMGVV